MRFGNSYKDLELLSSQSQAHPLGAREVKSHDISVPCHTQTQCTFILLSTACFALIFRYTAGSDVGSILKCANLKARESRAPNSVGSNGGLTLDGSAQAMPLVSDRLKGLEPLRPVSFSGEGRLISPFLIQLFWVQPRFSRARLWELGMWRVDPRGDTAESECAPRGWGERAPPSARTCINIGIFFPLEPELASTCPGSGRL